MKLDNKHVVIFATRFEASKFKPSRGVELIFSGIGKEKAKKCIDNILTRNRPHCVINSGFAGALNPELPLGAIVYQTSYENDRFFRESGAIHAKFYCTDEIITSPKEKHALFIKTGADAVDMESEIIFNTCMDYKIPCYIIRVISDDAKSDIPINFNKPFDIFKGIVKTLIDPEYMRKIKEFGKNLNCATKVLASFLEHYFQHHL